MSPFFGSPAPAGSEPVPGGMLYTTQCHQPLPVGASGSCISKAKLWVPAGAPLQASAGETFPPLQPNSLKTWVLASVSPSVKSVLVRVNFGMAPVSWAVGAAASSVVAARASAASDTCVLHTSGLMAVTPPTVSSRQKDRRAAVCSAPAGSANQRMLVTLRPGIALATPPVTGFHAPAVTGRLPAVRYPAAAGPRSLPEAGMPGVAAALPEPRTLHSEIAGGGCHAHHFEARRRRGFIGDHALIARSGHHGARGHGDGEQHAGNRQTRGDGSHRAASCWFALGCGTI